MKSENKLIKLYKKKPLINYSLNVLKKSKANKIIIVLGHQYKEVKKIIKKKTNQQLNRFSNIYFNKIKKDIIINEL